MIEYKNLIDTLEIIGERIKSEYKSKLKSKGLYSTGKLYNSIGYKIEVTDNIVELVFTAADYYLKLENGRRPGGKMPSITTIRKWMLTKGIPDKDGRAYLIARSIAKKGIQAKPYLKQIRTSIENAYTVQIQDALQKDIKQVLSDKVTEAQTKLK